MSDVQTICVEIASLLTNNIRLKLEPELHTNLEELDKGPGKNFGLIYVLQLIDTLDNPDEYIVVNCHDLFYKLKQLADAIIFSDFGEISVQNSLYNKLIKLCDVLNPDHNNRKEIRVRKLTGFSMSSTLLYTNTDDRDSHSHDPLYQKIAEIFNLSVSGKFSQSEISDRIDEVIELFNVKSPIRCKIAFIDQLNEVSDAVKMAKNENVFYTSYLTFKAEQIYALLKYDTCQKYGLGTEMKIAFSTFLKKCKQTNVFVKIYRWICDLLDDVAEFISSKYEIMMRDNCILISVVHIVLLMSVLI